MPKDKKEKKPRKPRAKKVPKKKGQTQTQTQRTQKQSQTVIVNVGGRGKARPKPAPQLPQTIIRMNEPALPLPLQPTMPLREPVKEVGQPSRLEASGFPVAEASRFPSFLNVDNSYVDFLREGQSSMRGRPPLSPEVIKEREFNKELERERKRAEREILRKAKQDSKPPPKPRGRPKKMTMDSESGYEN